MKSLKNKIQNLILLVISTILTIPKIVWGATVENIGPQSGLTMFDFRPYIFNICTVILGVIGLVSIMMLIYGTAVWFTAGGNEDWEDHAKRLGHIIGYIYPGDIRGQVGIEPLDLGKLAGTSWIEPERSCIISQAGKSRAHAGSARGVMVVAEVFNCKTDGGWQTADGGKSKNE